MEKKNFFDQLTDLTFKKIIKYIQVGLTFKRNNIL